MESVETRNKNKQRIKTNQCAPGWARNSVENRRNPVFLCYYVLMITKEQIIKDANRVSRGMLFVCVALIPLGLMGVITYLFFNQSVILGATGLLSLIIGIPLFISAIYKMKHIENNGLFMAYGSIDNYVQCANEALKQNRIFEKQEEESQLLGRPEADFFVTEKYVMDGCNNASCVDLAKITTMSKRTDNGKYTSGYYVDLTLDNGHEQHYRFASTPEEDVNAFVRAILDQSKKIGVNISFVNIN